MFVWFGFFYDVCVFVLVCVVLFVIVFVLGIGMYVVDGCVVLVVVGVLE